MTLFYCLYDRLKRPSATFLYYGSTINQVHVYFDTFIFQIQCLKIEIEFEFEFVCTIG